MNPNLIPLAARGLRGLSALFASCFLLLPAGGVSAVDVWEETIVLPTYLAGEPERSPMFYFGRASQGAEGRVYPYPLYDTLTWDKEDRPYRLIYVENGGEEAGPLHVLSYNLWDGFGPKPEPRRERWLEWMSEQRPDVAALQELNGYTPERLASEARGWGHGYSVLLKEDGHPTGLTSRTPITEIARIQDGLHHGLLRGKTRGIYFYVIHFHPSNFERRIEEAGHLLKDIAQLPDRDACIVLIGDFNGFSPDDRFFYEREPAIEPFFAMLDKRHSGAKNLNAGRLDYGGIERILEAGYVDVIARLRPSAGPVQATFPTDLRRDEELGPDRRIDYVFVSPNLSGTVRAARIIRDETTALLSDHYPLEVILEVP